MLRNLSSLSSPFSMTKTDCSLGTSETKRGRKKKKDERQSSSKSAVKRGIQREMRYWRGRGVEGRNPFWFAASFVFPSTPSAARTREKREGGEEEPLQINRESYASKYLFHGRNFRWLYRQIEHTGIINLSYY